MIKTKDDYITYYWPLNMPWVCFYCLFHKSKQLKNTSTYTEVTVSSIYWSRLYNWSRGSSEFTRIGVNFQLLSSDFVFSSSYERSLRCLLVEECQPVKWDCFEVVATVVCNTMLFVNCVHLKWTFLVCCDSQYWFSVVWSKSIWIYWLYYWIDANILKCQ